MIIEAHIRVNLPKYPPLYICKEPSTNPTLFMQNKPNFLNTKMNINFCLTNDYEYKMPLRPTPKQTQSNPISPSILSLGGITAQNQTLKISPICGILTQLKINHKLKPTNK